MQLKPSPRSSGLLQKLPVAQTDNKNVRNCIENKMFITVYINSSKTNPILLNLNFAYTHKHTLTKLADFPKLLHQTLNTSLIEFEQTYHTHTLHLTLEIINFMCDF